MYYQSTRMLQVVFIVCSMLTLNIVIASPNASSVLNPNSSSSVITKQENSKQIGIHRSILSDIIPQLALALGFVLIIIFVGAYLNNRLGFFNKYTNNKLKIDAVLSLSNKHKLILVNAENRKYFLAMTPDEIKKIDQFEYENEDTQDVS